MGCGQQVSPRSKYRKELGEKDICCRTHLWRRKWGRSRTGQGTSSPLWWAWHPWEGEVGLSRNSLRLQCSSAAGTPRARPPSEDPCISRHGPALGPPCAYSLTGSSPGRQRPPQGAASSQGTKLSTKGHIPRALPACPSLGVVNFDDAPQGKAGFTQGLRSLNSNRLRGWASTRGGRHWTPQTKTHPLLPGL